MSFFGRLFVPLFAVLFATGAWLVVDYEKDTIFAMDGVEPVPEERTLGSLATAMGPIPNSAQPANAVSADKRSRERFARPFDRAETRPRVAVIVTGLGLGREASQRAIDELPPAVTLAFSPYAENLGPMLRRAREKGHEILLAVPMEPADPKRRDAGPAALSVTHSEGATRQRFNWMLGRINSHIGVIGDLGDRFARDPVAMKPLFEEMAAKRLLYVENRLESPEASGIANGVPMASVMVWLDRDLSAEAIGREAAEAEAQAKRGGSVVVVARPYPATLDRLSAWMKSLNAKGLVAAPISAVAKAGS
jgi:uncharacterized protein